MILVHVQYYITIQPITYGDQEYRQGHQHAWLGQYILVKVGVQKQLVIGKSRSAEAVSDW